MDYIERDELQIKREMCRFLGLRPLFILRHAPKSYIDRVRRAAGYTMLFDIQVWPFGHELLIDRVRHELGLPLDSPRAIPAGIFTRFLNWLTPSLPSR